MIGVPLHGGPERPLPEAVRVKPGLGWRVEDARAMGSLSRKAAGQAWNQLQREKGEGCCSQQSQKEGWRVL